MRDDGNDFSGICPCRMMDPDWVTSIDGCSPRQNDVLVAEVEMQFAVSL